MTYFVAAGKLIYLPFPRLLRGAVCTVLLTSIVLTLVSLFMPIIIIIIKLYLNTVLFHKLLTFNLIMYKREGK
jgi:hypothetical protein